MLGSFSFGFGVILWGGGPEGYECDAEDGD